MPERAWRRALPVAGLRRAFAYDALSGALRRRSTGEIVGCRNGRGYLVVSFEGRSYLVHRICWAIEHGECPEHLDHINGDGSDNRLANLRQCTQATNNQNMKARKSASRFKGVTRWSHRGVAYWRARIKVNGREISLGYFASEEDAGAAYIAAADKHFGEFARAA